MTTSTGGVVAALYGPSQFNTTIDASPVTIDEQTDYPFSDTIQFVFHADHPVAFPFLVRIPGWTNQPEIDLNNQLMTNPGNPGSFTTIQRTFADGDTVTLHLPMPIKIHNWDYDTISIERGPLVYSLKIQEDSKPVQDAGTTPAFPAWDKRPSSNWNYALELNGASDIHVLTKKITGSPWDTNNSPIELTAPARQITNWKLAKDGANPGFPSDPHFADQVQTVSLVPYGSTCLRLTVFPVK
jgi:hypothetical protein